jgi:hypothetical protein
MKHVLVGLLAVAGALAACNKDAAKKDAADTASGSSDTASKLDDVTECKDYLAKVEACGDSTLESRRSAVEKTWSSSKNKSAVKKFCTSMAERYTCRPKSEKADKGDKDDKDKSTDEPAPSAKAAADDDGPLGIKECDDYLAKLKECGESDGFIKTSRKGFKIKIDEGKDTAKIAKGCGTLAKVYKCKK